MGQTEKVCVLCGQSCAGQPRIRNEKGQYAHQSCLKAKQQGRSTEAAQPLQADAGLGGVMDDLLVDLEPIEEAVPAGVVGCPGCGMRMADGAVVCLNCGFNVEAGKGLKTKTFEAKDRKGKPKAAEGESALADLGAGIAGLGMKPILPLVGALIGGAIGAAIWATIAYTTGYEVGYIAILVGAMCGAGARLGGGAETTGGGMIAGLLAASMAIVSIGAGKYIALNMIIDRDYGGNIFQVQPITLYDMEDEGIFEHMAFVLCEQKINAGEQIDWDNPALPIDVAMWPDDYPDAVQDSVVDQWDAMSDAEQLRFRRNIANENGMLSYRDVEIEWALQVLADEYAWSLINAGEAIEWPNPHLFNESAIWPDDYPEAVQEEVAVQWASLSTQDQDAKRMEAVDAYNEYVGEVDAVMGDITFQAVLESFKRPRHILSLLFALWIAYRLGNNDE
jgi:hypothetical protein